VVVVIAERLPVDRADAAEDDEAANDRSPRPPKIAAVTTARAMIVDHVRLLLVLDRCRPRLQSRQGGVTSTYVVFDMSTIWSGLVSRAQLEDRGSAFGLLTGIRSAGNLVASGIAGLL
jgi:hypothetical protein